MKVAVPSGMIVTVPARLPFASVTGTGVGPGLYTVLLPGSKKPETSTELPSGLTALERRLVETGAPVLLRLSLPSTIAPGMEPA